MSYCRRLVCEFLTRGQITGAIAAVIAKARLHGLWGPGGERGDQPPPDTEIGKSFDQMNQTEKRDLARRIAFMLYQDRRTPMDASATGASQ